MITPITLITVVILEPTAELVPNIIKDYYRRLVRLLLRVIITYEFVLIGSDFIQSVPVYSTHHISHTP